MKRRVAIFTSACCTGWCLAYDADDDTQTMIRKHAETYNLPERWKQRNCDGSVVIFDDVESALEDHNRGREEADDPDNLANDLQELFEFFASDGHGELTEAAWIVHMLLSDPMGDDWLPY